MLRRLFKWLQRVQPPLDIAIGPPAADVPVVPNGSQRAGTAAAVVPAGPVQPRLHRYLEQAAVSRWPAEKILFHGCTERSKHTDIAARRLNGDYKWVSEDPVYAAEYAFYQGKNSGCPYLFVCHLAQDVIALEGNQSSLHKLTDWGSTAPGRFPIEFGPIAKKALRAPEPVIFLDHFHEETQKWAEILIPDPASTLRVIDVILLPKDKEVAKQAAASYHVRR